jgi:hypothetical protein
MDTTSPAAWQPLTPRGVAAFAPAPLRRLLLVQFIVAVLVALAVGWFLYDGYFPVINQAIAQLPTEGQVREQKLDWRGATPALLAENRFLALSVDLEQSAKLRSVAHVQLEFGRTNFFAYASLGLGYAEIIYPAGWGLAANRAELQPLWGAWRPAVLVGAMVLVIVGLFTGWFFLATLYAGPVWLLGFFLNRDLSLRGSWRLCGAALMPGALLLVVAISFYDLGVMDLVQLAFIYVAHLVLGWVFILVSPFSLPRLAASGKSAGNPFTKKSAK